VILPQEIEAEGEGVVVHSQKKGTKAVKSTNLFLRDKFTGHVKFRLSYNQGSVLPQYC